MRWIFASLVLLLVGLPAASLAYKVRVLGLPLLPVEERDTWRVELNVEPDNEPGAERVRLPLPTTAAPGFTIQNLRWSGRSATLVGGGESNYVSFSSAPSLAESTLFSVQGVLRRHRSSTATQIQAPATSEEALDVTESLAPFVQPELVPKLNKTAALLGALPDPKPWRRGPGDELDRVKRFYYYVLEEITTNESITDVALAFEQRRGSSFARAVAFAALTRHFGTPARVLVGAYVDEIEPQSHAVEPTYIVEVWVNDNWVYVDLNRGSFGPVHEAFWLISREGLGFYKALHEAGATVGLRLVPRRVRSVKGMLAYDEVLQASPVFRHLSLIHLPPSQQSHFALLLLLPLAALVLAFARNVIGIRSFGIFTPVLLGIFFREVSIYAGITVFCVVTALGFAGRLFLEKLRLLAVPRLSIILSSTIFLIVLFAVQNEREHYFPTTGLTLVPLVILTVFIERFSVTFAEEGWLNTLQELAGTLAIALMTYLVLKPEDLKLFLLAHPEVTLWWMAGMMLLGIYSGYRLSELKRFSAFLPLRKADKS